MDLRRISDPLPRADKLKVVTIADVKAQARIIGDDETALIERYIVSAYDYLSGPDGWLNGMCLLEEEFELTFGGLQRGHSGFDIPVRPLTGDTITSFESLSGQDYVPVPFGLYTVTLTEPFARIRKFGYGAWPYFGIPNSRAYRVRFKAGFGGPEDVPDGIKLAITMLAAHWFNVRETVTQEGKIAGTEIEYGLKSLCARYRVAKDHS